MNRLRGICCCLVMGTVLFSTFAEEVDLDNLKSRQARNAVSSFNRKVDAARKEYDEVVSKEREKMIEELENALKKETTEGNLDEAIKLKSAIESLNQEAGVDPMANRKQPGITGLWKLQFSDGLIRYQQFVLRNGNPYTLRFREIGGKIDDQGSVEVRDGKAYVRYQNWAILERFTIDGDRLIVEHWNVGTNNSIERFPELLCIGTRVEEPKE